MATLHVRQGDDYAAVVTVEGVTDLTGWSGTAQVRRQPADWSPLVVAFGVVVGTTTVTLGLTAEQTAQLRGAYVWDAKLTNAEGTRRTLIGGAVWVTPEVTRAAA